MGLFAKKYSGTVLLEKDLLEIKYMFILHYRLKGTRKKLWLRGLEKEITSGP